MTDPQENKLSSYRVAEKLLDDNSIIWNTKPAFVTTKGIFSGKIVAINAASAQQQAIITGIATDKKVLKLTLVDTAAPIAAAVIAYASQTNNNELLQAVNFTHSQLLQTRDDMLGGRCLNIYTKANDNILALADYGILPADLTALQSAMTAYAVKVPAPGTAKLTKRTATINLRNLFKETDVILKLQLDKLMLAYKKTNSDFYNGYLGARVIHDLGASHTKLRMFVKEQNGTFIQGAVLSLSQNNLVIYSLISDAQGKLNLTKIKPGIYDVKVMKTGFLAKAETGIKFVAGKTVKRTFTLFPGASNPTLITVVREGDLAMGAVANISLSGFNGTPTSTLTIEATGSPVRVYASATIDGLPGATFVDVASGIPLTKPTSDFALQIGLDDTKKYLMVQNNGAGPGHYKFTFTNVEPL